MSRPQDKNLVPLTERSEEEAHAIRSAGGKAKAESDRRKKLTSELLQLYSDLPITDKRKANRLKKLGIEEADLTQKALIADAIINSTKEDVDIDDLPELQQEAESDADVVE